MGMSKELLKGLLDNPEFLKSAGLMTGGAGAAYGLARNNDGSMSVGPGSAEAAKLPKVLDFGDVKLPLDSKGLATLYHATTPEAADKIVASKSLRSAGEPSVYFSTSKEGTGYGPAVVEAKVPGSMLQMDDAFPDGRADFRVDKSTLPLAYAKRIAGLGLTGAGAYGLMGSDSDANAMSYIGPKGMAGLLGPDKAKALLSEAEQLAAKGVDNEAVRQATGVFKGMDGKWRYELDDSGAQFSRAPNLPPHIKPEDVGHYLYHPTLYDAQPDLAWMPMNPSDPSLVGGQSGVLKFGKIGMAENSGTPTLLHELQHAIQQREGFAQGGTPSLMAWASPSQRGDLLKVAQQTMDGWKPAPYEQFWGKEVTPEGQAAYADYLKDFSSKEQEAVRWNAAQQGAPGKIYENLAGEIEARDTAKRMNLTPEQRRATPPDLRDNAIVRFDQNGPNEASGLMGYNAPPRFSVDPKRVAAEALQDAYSPADMLVAALTGGGGLAARAAQGALDPLVSAGMEYLPKFADAINPRNIITGLMR